MGIMDRSARLLVSEMGWVANKEAIDMQQSIQDMTLNVVGQSAFGYTNYLFLFKQKLLRSPAFTEEDYITSRKMKSSPTSDIATCDLILR